MDNVGQEKVMEIYIKTLEEEGEKEQDGFIYWTMICDTYKHLSNK